MVKQVIVMRRTFENPDGKSFKVRTGKMIAQGAHASMAVILNMMSNERQGRYLDLESRPEVREWLEGKFTKICVYVENEQELLEIYNKALTAQVPCVLITDSGLTEFHGVPTNTCIAIGPADALAIDEITGGLKLL